VPDPSHPDPERMNPYAPPTARVSDIPSGTPIGPDKNVELACKLMWLGLWLSLLDGVLDLFHVSGAAEIFGTLIGTLVGLGIGYVIVRWFTRTLRAGRNWMRWLITILNVLGWLTVPIFWDFYARFVLPQLIARPISMVSLLVQSVVGIVAVVLLHTGSARQWFRAHSGADTPI
jgi:hypothetical protein